jgi:hypothetical protein
MELDRSRGSVRVSLLVLNDFGEQDAAINAQRRGWQFSSTGAAFAFSTSSLRPLRFAKKGIVNLQPENFTAKT